MTTIAAADVKDEGASPNRHGDARACSGIGWNAPESEGDSDMRPTGLTANLNVPSIEEARSFYTDYLGLSVEEMNLGWVARFTTPDGAPPCNW